MGIGHVKSVLLHRLKNYFDTVFLDVGQGIGVLAGVIDTEKPYFGAWQNFRLDDPKFYFDVDYLSYLPHAFVHPE